MVAGTGRNGVQSSSDAAYQEIKAWILAGEIPLGMRLSEGRAAARLSMSRTPVREALSRLFAERFVERHHEGGYRVNHPRAQTMHELYDVRKALELFAIGRSCSGGHEAQERLVELRERWHGLAADAPELDADFVVHDEQYHAQLAAANGNVELVAALQRVAERIRPVRTHDFLTPGRIATTIGQHLEIVEAVIDGDASAVALLDDHICESQGYVETAVGRVLERMLTTSESDLTW